MGKGVLVHQPQEGFVMLRALAVAKELVKLSLSGEEKDPLTNLRLQKLLYYAQAWSLVLRESELFPEEIEAWRWGPVVPTVYNELPDGQGASQIPADMFVDAPDLPPEDVELVRSVWEAYDQYSALQLSRMTHQEAPWLRAWGDRPTDGTGTGNDPIKVDDLEDYFGKQSVPAPLAAFHYELRKREEEAEKKLAEFPRLDTSRLRTASKSYTPAAKVRCGAGE
jgi:uncharacterized phage-associated protein